MEHNDLPPDNSSSSRGASDEISSTGALIPTRDFGGNLVNGILQTHQKFLISPAALLRFSDRLAQLQAQLHAYATSVNRYVRAHPREIGFALFCMFFLAIVPVILPAIGFSSMGPVAGSLAAAWQSAIGAVVAGSPFAILQSAAMGGAAAGVITGVGVAGFAALAAKKVGEWAWGAWGKWGKKGEGENEKED